MKLKYNIFDYIKEFGLWIIFLIISLLSVRLFLGNFGFTIPITFLSNCIYWFSWEWKRYKKIVEYLKIYNPNILTKYRMITKKGRIIMVDLGGGIDKIDIEYFLNSPVNREFISVFYMNRKLLMSFINILIMIIVIFNL